MALIPVAPSGQLLLVNRLLSWFNDKGGFQDAKGVGSYLLSVTVILSLGSQHIKHLLCASLQEGSQRSRSPSPVTEELTAYLCDDFRRNSPSNSVQLLACTSTFCLSICMDTVSLDDS